MNKMIIIAALLILIIAAAAALIFSAPRTAAPGEETQITDSANSYLQAKEGAGIEVSTSIKQISSDTATVESSVTWPDAPGTGIVYELTLKKSNGMWTVQSEKVLREA
jgi:gas vesicle protein